MNDLWGWISESVDHFRQTGDRRRFEIATLYHHAMQSMDTDPQESLERLHQARQIAERFGERWWVVLCDHWRAQVLINRTGEIDEGLQTALHAIAIAESDPIFRQLPQRVCLRDDRASALLLMDPHGYETEIKDACDYIEDEGAGLEGCGHCMRSIRIDTMILSENLEGAQELAVEGLKSCRTKTSSHYTPQYYAALCRISFIRKDWEQLKHWSSPGPLFYGKMGSEISNAELLIWNALALRQTGDECAAKDSYRLARSVQRHATYGQTAGFYDALAAYYEIGGILWLALVARSIELGKTSGAPYRECCTRLERLRLMKAIGLPTDEEAGLVREAAARLRDPKPILRKLAELEPELSPAQ